MIKCVVQLINIYTDIYIACILDSIRISLGYPPIKLENEKFENKKQNQFSKFSKSQNFYCVFVLLSLKFSLFEFHKRISRGYPDAAWHALVF